MPCKILFKLIPLVLLAGCSVPEFYLDVHHPATVIMNEPLPLDVFITNSHANTIVHIESIQLTGELAQNSQLIPGRNGLYSKPDGSDIFLAIPNRKLTQFETGTFSLTIRPVKAGEFSGIFIFTVNGGQITREISVLVK